MSRSKLAIYNELLDLAAKAKPPTAKSTRWVHLVPVVAQLQANGFKLLPAIHWLRDQGQINDSQVASVYRSIRQYNQRNS